MVRTAPSEAAFPGAPAGSPRCPRRRGCAAGEARARGAVGGGGAGRAGRGAGW
jgi:hypothetical protein